MAVLFADIYKPVKDFLTKNHTAGKTTLETKAKAPGTLFSAKLERPNDKTDVAGEVAFEYDLTVKQVPVKFKTEGLTAGRTKAKLSSEKLYPGLKLELSADAALAGKAKDTYELLAELKKPEYTLTAKTTCTTPGRKLFDFAIAGLVKGVHVGGNAVLDCGTFGLWKWALGVRWAQGATTVSGVLEDVKAEPGKDGSESTAAKIGFSTKVASGTVLGAELDYASSRRAAPFVVSVGSEASLQEALTLKTRATTLGVATASFIQTYSPTLKLTYSTEYDLAKGALKWGFNATFDA